MAIALFSCRAPTNLTPKPSSVTAKTAVSSLMSPNTTRTPSACTSSARAWNTGTIRLSCMAVLACVDRAPDALRGDGHVEVFDAEFGERVDDRVDNRAERRRRAPFAAAAQPERV